MSDLFSTEAEIDFDRAASAFPDISVDGSDTFHTPAPSQAPSLGFSFDDFETPPTTDVKVTGDDEIEKFESDFPVIDAGLPSYTPQRQPTFSASPAPTFAPRAQPSGLSNTPILTQQLDEDEPQVIKDWREKQAAEIKARDEASAAKREATIARAKRTLDEFYDDYAAKTKRNIRENKDQEEEYLAKMSSSLSSGTTWERIADFVELQNSQSKTLARTGTGTTDLSRFKEVLLRLKREGASAPGAAGY